MKPKPTKKAAPAAEPERRQPSPIELRLEAFGRTPLAYAVVSALLLLPCFWHSRIQAGDLSSHIYNTWLAQLIEAGKTTGLQLDSRSTNVLFDLMLSVLFRAVGADWAQRIAVAACVLVFSWGAFFCVSKLSGSRPWPMMPFLAILAYGWTFHMGFFNMYLSLGLCLWAIGAAWDGSRKGIVIAAALLALAYVAHGLPVVWALALGAYCWVARRAGDRWLPTLLGVSAAAILLLRVLLESVTIIRWYPEQALSATGVYQALVFGEKYLAVALIVAALWAALLFSLWRKEGARALLHNLPFHFAALTAAGIMILPTGVAIPGYQHGLLFIAERMSLALGVCICAVAARSAISRIAGYAALGAAVLFFAFLYSDTGVLNALEDKVTAAVAPLRGQRVVSGFMSEGLHVDPTVHMIDRACAGVCYSYANYEPTTSQFRVRAVGPNPFVLSTYPESFDMQIGRYVVKPSDLPLYRVDINENGDAVARPLQAGAPNGITTWQGLQ